ncbi:MAG TPA: class I SAM-dependent methyltransferase [Steroidobacteraceae bacterium]|nr:class I SAM-dependent methyltransferase [Steroidobacteraceae bacterium]
MAFDRAYYHRYYFNPRTSVTSRKEMDARGVLIAAYTEYVGLPVRRILDAGCGIGALRRPLLRRLTRASYQGLEFSEYLCQRYGWTQGSVEDFRAAAPFDLVICYDVVQYLDAAAATRALENLARLCRGVLYFSALTRADWHENCDQRRTDPDVYRRTGTWYRKRLRRRFVEVGAGLWLRRGAPLATWELETVGKSP